MLPPKYLHVRTAGAAALLTMGLGAESLFTAQIAMAAVEQTTTTRIQNADGDKPAAIESRVVGTTATVEGIDYPRRDLQLKGETGNRMTVHVGPEVTRFNEIKKGDRVTLDYFGAVAVSVQPEGSAMPDAGAATAVVRDPGRKPSGLVVNTDSITATVNEIDPQKRTAILTGPDGNAMHVDIAPGVQGLDKIKKGDQVTVRYTRSVAIAVRKPGQM